MSAKCTFGGCQGGVDDTTMEVANTVGCGDAVGSDKVVAGVDGVTNADEMPDEMPDAMADAIAGAGVVAFVARAAGIESPHPATNRATPASPRTSSRLIGGAPKAWPSRCA